MNLDRLTIAELDEAHRLALASCVPAHAAEADLIRRAIKRRGPVPRDLCANRCPHTGRGRNLFGGYCERVRAVRPVFIRHLDFAI